MKIYNDWEFPGILRYRDQFSPIPVPVLFSGTNFFRYRYWYHPKKSKIPGTGTSHSAQQCTAVSNETKQYETSICKITRELDLTVLSMVSRMGQANLKNVCKSLPGKREGETFTALARTVNDSGQSNFEARTVGNCRCFSVIY